MAEKDDPVAHTLNLVHIVRGIENRRPIVPLQIQQNLSHLDRRLKIKVSSRLIEQQQFRIVQKRFAQPNPRSLAGGQSRNRFVLQASDAESLEQFIDFPAGSRTL